MAWAELLLSRAGQVKPAIDFTLTLCYHKHRRAVKTK